MWNIIMNEDVAGLQDWLNLQPEMAFLRSKDGRGPMWWAFEKRNEKISTLLMGAGVPHTDKDANGLTPMDLLQRHS
jgi:dolichyl-diphosphooligosaccharide---protein glycosyltransferase